MDSALDTSDNLLSSFPFPSSRKSSARVCRWMVGQEGKIFEFSATKHAFNHKSYCPTCLRTRGRYYKYLYSTEVQSCLQKKQSFIAWVFMHSVPFEFARYWSMDKSDRLYFPAWVSSPNGPSHDTRIVSRSVLHICFSDYRFRPPSGWWHRGRHLQASTRVEEAVWGLENMGKLKLLRCFFLPILLRFRFRFPYPLPLFIEIALWRNRAKQRNISFHAFQESQI